MHPQSAVRHLYRPTQAIGGGGGPAYAEYPPDERLRELVYCYWELTAPRLAVAPLRHRVLADACIDVFFDRRCPDRNFLMGFSERFVEFALEPGFHYAGIRFLPAVLPLLCGLHARDFTNGYFLLADVIPRLARRLVAAFGDLPAQESPAAALDGLLLPLATGGLPTPDGRFHGALITVLERGGDVAAADLATGVSDRQLRRLFNRYLGTSPKTFSRVIRFQRALRDGTHPAARGTAYYLDAGYFDQAHFIKDFRQFSGESPVWGR